MKLYVQTDMEGVAGIINVDDYLSPTGRYYDKAKHLVTADVNAAIRGFSEGGFDDIVVADGHGSGAIDIEQLDSRVRLMRGWPTGWPLLLDESYDALAFVGQHAKACTPLAHIPHTQWFGMVDLSINGISVGEYGQMVLCANELDIPTIFGSGDEAFCAEAGELTPWVETVSGKQGTAPGTGEDLEHDAYGHSHETAIHRHPEVVREDIEKAALAAARRFRDDPTSFGRVDIKPPYKLVAKYRQVGEKPPRTAGLQHGNSIAALMNMMR